MPGGRDDFLGDEHAARDVHENVRVSWAHALLGEVLTRRCPSIFAIEVNYKWDFSEFLPLPRRLGLPPPRDCAAGFQRPEWTALCAPSPVELKKKCQCPSTHIYHVRSL